MVYCKVRLLERCVSLSPNFYTQYILTSCELQIILVNKWHLYMFLLAIDIAIQTVR